MSTRENIRLIARAPFQADLVVTNLQKICNIFEMSLLSYQIQVNKSLTLDFLLA